MKIRFVVFGTELSTGLSTLLIALMVVAIVSLVASNKIAKEKDYRLTSTFTAIIDYVINGLRDLVIGLVGEDLADEFMPLSISLFFVLLLANTMSLIGIQEAVTDLVVPLFLVICLFAAWTIYALKTVGFKAYGKGIIGANILLAPLEILGRITSPLSMGLRIFGNILSGYIIMSLVWLVVGMLISSGSILLIVFGIIATIFSIGLIGYFSVFSPVIQALVFTSLALSNYKQLIEE